MSGRRRRLPRDGVLGWLAVALGLALALLVQARAPVGVPLYDGVSVAEPYRWLHPTGGHAGDPMSASESAAVVDGLSPVLPVATGENPPQAQLVATKDAFEVPPGTTDVSVSITPVEPTVQPVDGTIAGNVYRFAVTGANGIALTPKPCPTCRTLVLRAPDGVADGKLAHLDGGAWVEVATGFAVGGLLQTNADTMGDFAVIVPAGSSGTGGGIDPLIFGGVALVVFFAAVAALFWYRRRPPPVPVARLGPDRGRTSPKHKGPRRPSGRSGS